MYSVFLSTQLQNYSGKFVFFCLFLHETTPVMAISVIFA